MYAAHVAMALEARGLTCWAVITSLLRDDDLNAVRNQSKPRTLREWNDAGVLIGHVMVQFEYNGRIWRHDARNTVLAKSRREPTFGKLLCPGYLTVPELVTIAAARTGWNPAFSRRSGVPAIRAAVRRHLGASGKPHERSADLVNFAFDLHRNVRAHVRRRTLA